MELTSVDLLYQEWQWLVQECARAMRDARLSGLSKRELRIEEQRYGVRIDAAYARLKQAEARSPRSFQNF